MKLPIQLAQNGNKICFNQIIYSIKNDLYRIAKSKLNNEEDINDVLQDTILDIYSNINQLKDHSLYKTWVIKILINNCNNKLREKYKYNSIFSLDSIDDCENLVSDEDSFNCLYSDMNYESIIECLSEKEKMVFTLFYQENFTIKEISFLLEINDNTVKSILKRGKEKIKIKYGKENIYG